MRTLIAAGPPEYFEVRWVRYGPAGSVQERGTSVILADSGYDAFIKLNEIWPERSCISSNFIGSKKV
jgi:hypothetical protein